MTNKEKKGDTKKPKKGKAEIFKKSKKSEKPTEPAKSLPKLHKDTGGTKLKVVPPVSTPKKGASIARENRLKRAGFETYICPITFLPLDIGPRANEWLKPIEYQGQVISWLARVILESKITAEQLKKTADILGKK